MGLIKKIVGFFSKKKLRTQSEIEDYLVSIIQDIGNDWVNDRRSSKTSAKNGVFKYELNNGNSIEMDGKHLIFFNRVENQKETFTLTLTLANQIVDVFNRITKQINDSNKVKESNKVKQNNNHPKRDLYDTLLKTIQTRKDQLRILEYDDPNRKELDNELGAAKERADKMKIKYDF